MPGKRLTNEQIEQVLELAKQDLSNSKIGRQLGISKGTVERIRSGLRIKKEPDDLYDPPGAFRYCERCGERVTAVRLLDGLVVPCFGCYVKGR